MDKRVRPEWDATDQSTRVRGREDDRQAAQGGPRGVAALAAAHAARVGRDGARPDGDGRRVGRGRQGLDRPVRAQRPGARRGQPAHAPALGDRRAEGEVPPPAVRRHGPLVLRDDRARGRRLRPDADQDVRLPGRRRVGDQRPQVVHLRRSRRRSSRCSSPRPRRTPRSRRRATRASSSISRPTVGRSSATSRRWRAATTTARS